MTLPKLVDLREGTTQALQAFTGAVSLVPMYGPDRRVRVV